MLNPTPKPHHKVLKQKRAMRLAAFALFLSLTAATHHTEAVTNKVDGIAYGTNYVDLATTNSIASIADGAGFLDIGFAGTTNLSLNHDIIGTIIVSNNFDTMTIDATGGKISGSQAFAVLTVAGGTNLTITGGQFIGETSSGGIVLPPIPGQPSQTNTVSSSAIGGVIYNTSNVLISGTTFAGNTYSPSGTSSLGTDGLRLINISSATISNGTIKGGNAMGASALSIGGTALTSVGSTVTIVGGTFTGGTSGTADTSFGGWALHATNSTIHISGTAVFTGGTGAAALYARNSDLSIDGGTFQGGALGTNAYFGLVSIADAAHTNSVVLNGGTFNSIDFAGSGVQLLTAGAGLMVDGLVVIDGGTIIADNQSSTPFQQLFIRSGNLEFLNDYTLSSDGYLGFVIATNSQTMLTASSASFETNSTIDVDASMANFSYGTNDVALVSAAGGIFVIDAGGITNSATSTNLDENVHFTTTVFGRTQLADVLVGGGSNLIFRFTTERLKDYWNATGEFGDLTDELETLITPEMNTTINLINDPALSSLAVEQTYFTTFNSFQTALQGMRTAVGESISRGSELRDSQKLFVPYGAFGPMPRLGEKESTLRGWGKYYGNYYTHSEAGLYPSYETGLHGGVIGVDASFGNLILGLSGGASRYETVFDNDARENTTAAHGNVYGTYGAERGYIDAGIAYGQNKVDTRTAAPFRVDGSFDAQIANAYLGGGYELIDTKGGTVFTPEISVQYAKYKQDEYTEEGTAAVPRVFDEFDADSLIGSVGVNVAMQESRAMKTFAFQLDGRLHWMHEFNPDPDNLNFMLAGGSNSYQLDYPSLDEEIYRIGVGCSFFNTGRRKPRNVLFRVDFDELFGDNFNSHNISAKVIYAF